MTLLTPTDPCTLTLLIGAAVGLALGWVWSRKGKK